MKLADEFKKIECRFSIQICWNGYLLEVRGADHDGNYQTVSVLCNTREELDAAIDQLMTIEVER